jgi:hypothetical protein
MDNPEGCQLAGRGRLDLPRNLGSVHHFVEGGTTPVKRKESTKPAKVENPAPEFRVWCESCSIRIAPSEERTLSKGKSYHTRCYSKVMAAAKD